MCKALHLLFLKNFLFLALLFASWGRAQGCGMVINDPPCQSTPVDITAASVTAGSTGIGSLSYWLNINATAPLVNPAAVSQSGIYYIKNVTAGCTEVLPVKVTIGNTAPTGNSFLYTVCTSSTANSVFFDFQDIGQTSFTLSYSINGGPPTVVTQTAPTSYYVTGVSSGQQVVLTVAWNGVCFPPKQATGFVPGSNPNFPYNNTHRCVGEVLPTTAPNGITGTWSPTTIAAGSHTYTFSSSCYAPQTVTIIGDAPTVPTFNFPTTVCQGTSLPANYLPTTSTNGVSGTWSPATVSTTNAGTVSYTFTPNAALFPCAASKTVAIQVAAPSGQPTFNFPNNVALCSGATSNVPQLNTTSNNGITGSWSPSTVSTAASGTYIFTPDPGQCANGFTLQVTVAPTQTILFTGALGGNFNICQYSTPPVLPSVSGNTPAISGTWSPSVIDTSVPSVTSYVFTAALGQCVTAGTYSVTVTVTPASAADFTNQITDLTICHGETVPALPSVDDNGTIGAWSPSAIDNTHTGQYVFTPAANQCRGPFVLHVTVLQNVKPTFAPIAALCESSPPPVLPATSLEAVTGTWSPPVIDNTSNQTYTFTPDPNQGCWDNATLDVTIIPREEPNFANIVFCENDVVPILLPVSPNGYSGTWNPAVIDASNIAAEYIFTPDADQCAYPQSIQVTEHYLTLTDATATVSNYFEDGTVKILAVDQGNYLYQLDHGPLQESDTFTHVPPGVHDFTVYDANGCASPITKYGEIQIIGYPKFFTPNNDGIYDTWNITDLVDVGQPQARIFIFDRYGKLLKEIAPGGAGWDGTYNGQPLPASDYWFMVKYAENGQALQYRSHFALKR